MARAGGGTGGEETKWNRRHAGQQGKEQKYRVTFALGALEGRGEGKKSVKGAAPGWGVLTRETRVKRELNRLFTKRKRGEKQGFGPRVLWERKRGVGGRIGRGITYTLQKIKKPARTTTCGRKKEREGKRGKRQ